MCVYIYADIFIYTCVYIYILIRIRMHSIYIYTCMYSCIHVNNVHVGIMHLCLYIHTRLNVHDTHIHRTFIAHLSHTQQTTSECATLPSRACNVDTNIYIYAYIYIYIHTNIYIYEYKYIYIYI